MKKVALSSTPDVLSLLTIVIVTTVGICHFTPIGFLIRFIAGSHGYEMYSKEKSSWAQKSHNATSRELNEVSKAAAANLFILFAIIAALHFSTRNFQGRIEMFFLRTLSATFFSCYREREKFGLPPRWQQCCNWVLRPIYLLPVSPLTQIVRVDPGSAPLSSLSPFSPIAVELYRCLSGQ